MHKHPLLSPKHRGQESALARGRRCKMPAYKLIGADGKEYVSRKKGQLGGHRGQKIYGRLDCPSALRWIAQGHYVEKRVFFRDKRAALAAGYRPCACCLKEEYLIWKATRTTASNAKGA